MELKSVDAALLQKAVLAAAKGLEAKKEWINELNVFPVPDGDTGTNMTKIRFCVAKRPAHPLRAGIFYLQTYFRQSAALLPFCVKMLRQMPFWFSVSFFLSAAEISANRLYSSCFSGISSIASAHFLSRKYCFSMYFAPSSVRGSTLPQ